MLQDLIQMLFPQSQIPYRKSKRPRVTLEEMQAISTQYGPPPSDKKVKQWLDEHRMEKYG